MATSPLRVPKTAELVAAQLRRQIVEGDLSEGDSLPNEAVLRERFGVSRPTLREAFRVLEAEGLIEVHRGARGGARVRVPSDEAAARYAGLVLEHRGATLADVCAVRSIIEPVCAGIVAARCSADDVAALRQAVWDAEGATDTREQAEQQTEFHAQLVALAGNQTLALLHGIVQRILDQATARRFGNPTSEGEEAVHQGARAHHRLIDVIEAGDAERASRVWRRHLDETTEYLLRDGRSAMVLDLLS